MRGIAERFDGLDGVTATVFPAFIPAKNGKKALACMLTLSRTDWPREDVVTTLRSLPPYVRVVVDAEHVM